MSAPAIISSGTTAGGPPVGGSGTTNTIPRWTGPTTLGDSGLIDNGTAIYTTTRNVGVGTASPGAKLHTVVVDGVNYGVASSGTTKGFRTEHNATETRIVGVDNTLNVSYQPLVLGGSTLGFNTNGTTRAMTINASQQVIVGQASPVGRFSVTDVAGAGGQSGFNVGTVSSPVRGNLWYETDGSGWKFQIGKWQSSSFTPQMTFQDDGNVGIGTSSPSTRLHVSDNSSIPAIIQSSGSTDSFLRFINTTSNLGYIGYIGTNLYLAPNNGAGYVGVGTSSPTAKLHVTQGASGSFANLLIGSAGTSTNFYDANEHYWRNGTLATNLYMNASGNVVVGSAAIATNATNGFLYVPSCAGTPTGTPTTYTGRVPIVVDTTNNKLYFYSGGAWRDAGP